MLRVLMIAEYPFSDAEQGRGGVLQSTFHLIEGFEMLAAPSLELHVLSQTEYCRRRVGRKLNHVMIHYVPKGTSGFAKFVTNHVRMLIATIGIVWKLHPQIVHAQGAPIAILLSMLFSKKHVQTIHGILGNELSVLPTAGLAVGRRVRIWLIKWFEKQYFRKIKNLFYLSKEIAQLVDKTSKYHVQKFFSYVAIDPNFFEIKRSFEKDCDRIVILFVAAITPRKGLHFLLEAFSDLVKIHSNTELRIVGMQDWAKEYVADLQNKYCELVENKNIVFTGAVNRSRLAMEYDMADIFVLSSLSETVPAVISQAMLAGLPIVATRVGGIPEMIDDGKTGLLVPPSSAAALRDALDRLIAERHFGLELGRNAREVAYDRYHPKSVAQSTLDAYIRIEQNTHPILLK